MARYDKLISDELFPAFQAERRRLNVIDSWMRWEHDDPVSAQQATREHQELAKRAQTPLGHLIVTAAAQELYVEGYRPSSVQEDSDPRSSSPWRIWQANGMDARQIQLHRAALGYGEAYNIILPGRTTLGEPIPVIRPVSPRRGMAFWEDPADDDWPVLFFRADPAKIDGAVGWSVRVYDDELVERFLVSADGTKIEYVTQEVHGVGVCPVVRFANQLDLEGRTPGEIEPFIPIMGRIDQTTFDRLLIQRHASWKVRTVSGMTLPDEDEAQYRAKLKLSVADVLVAEDPDTRFGSLPETLPNGMIDSAKFDLQLLAAVSQTPSYELLGDLINLSAEALVAARSSLARKVEERKHSFGQKHEQTLRLASRIMGDLDAAQDWQSQVLWKDTEGRSLGQAADALGKLATMLGVPVEMLWERIPGWTQADVERAKEMVERGDSIVQLLSDLAAGQTSAPVDGDLS